MFRRHKHVFTCPDVIYLRERAKRNQRISIALNLAFMAALWTAGKVAEDRMMKESLAEDTDMPFPNHTA